MPPLEQPVAIGGSIERKSRRLWTRIHRRNKPGRLLTGAGVPSKPTLTSAPSKKPSITASPPSSLRWRKSSGAVLLAAAAASCTCCSWGLAGEGEAPCCAAAAAAGCWAGWHTVWLWVLPVVRCRRTPSLAASGSRASRAGSMPSSKQRQGRERNQALQGLAIGERAASKSFDWLGLAVQRSRAACSDA